MIPLSILAAGKLPMEPELDLVRAMPGWAPGFSDKPLRQRHVFALPRPGLLPLELFSQDIFNN